MLHRVMRASMSMAATTGPANSMTRLVAPLTPIRPIIDRITSLAYTLGEAVPVMSMRMVSGVLKGTDPFEYAHFQIGGSHAGGKGAEGPVGAGVRIAHDDGVAGADKPLFRKQGVADPIGTDVEEIGDAVAPAQSRRILPWRAVWESLAGVRGR
jgi:hypothetical protein